MRLIVRQQRRSQIGVVPVVRDPVLGVQQLLGLVGADEGGRTPVQDGPGHAGGGRDLLKAGREDQRGSAQVAAPEGQGLGLDGRLDAGVNLLQPRRRVQSS